MYRGFTVLFPLFFSTVVAAQQSTIDKSTPSVEQTNIHISAVAIPYDQIGNVVIDPATYHKAIQAGVEPVKPGRLVEISAPASQMNEHAPGKISKGIKSDGADNFEKSIHIEGRAQPVKPQ